MKKLAKGVNLRKAIATGTTPAEWKKANKKEIRMSTIKVKTNWKDVISYLKENELSREQRVDLLNYFNKQLNAFPVQDILEIKPDGIKLANGRELSLEQKESFLQGVRALSDNFAFKTIAEQVMYQAIKKGMHDATDFDQVYFSKVALYFFDLFKKYLDILNKLH